MVSMNAKVERNQNEVTERQQPAKDLGLKGDYANLCLLLQLYILQGIPIGLMVSIPMILSSNGVKYEKQAILSVAMYPQAAKLIWAPIVDSVYSRKFGRRKSWLIPVQYLLGVSLISISTAADILVGSKTVEPMIGWLTSALFLIILLASIQETAIDSWGITMLHKRNVHYVASAHSVGYVIGTFISTVLFLSLESPDFCNKWLRSVPQETGLLDVKTYLFVIGLLYISTTTMIWFFKREEDIVTPGEEIKGPIHTYRLLFRIMKLKSVLWFTAIQMTQYIGFSVFLACAELKFIQFGVRREVLSVVKTPASIMNIFLPFFIVHLTKKAPLIYFWKLGLVRQFVGISIIFIMYWIQTFNVPKDGYPWYVYAVLMTSSTLFEVILYANMMLVFAYMATVSDPNVGATYMTLFSTLSHIGLKIAITLSLSLIDPLTFTRTIFVNENVNTTISFINTNTMNMNETLIDTNLNSTMITTPKTEVVIDGFYVEALFCTVFGIIWFAAFKRIVWRMQCWPLDKWRLPEFRTKSMDNEINNNNDTELRTRLGTISEVKSDENFNEI